MWNKLTCTGIIVFLCAAGLGQEADPPPVKVLRGHIHKVNHICYNKTGDLLASCGWDLENKKIKHSLKAKNHSAYSLKFMNKDKQLFGVGGPYMNIWDIESESIIRRFEGQRGMTQCKFSPDGRYLASCAEDYTVGLRDFKSGDILWKYRGPKMEMSTLAFSPDGKYLAVGTPESDILIWDMNDILSNNK